MCKVATGLELAPAATRAYVMRTAAGVAALAALTSAVVIRSPRQ